MITIYGKDNCSYCEKAKELVPDAEYINLNKRPDLLERLKSQGFRTVPIVYSDQMGYLGGYNELKSYLEANNE